tara:strand:+ start:351 stop:926 length:576 start_codon:yes stop_codon:yes gene_type:complete
LLLFAGDCPSSVTNMTYTEITKNGITYTTGIQDNPSHTVITNQIDNRKTATSVFDTQGTVTMGHIDVFKLNHIEYTYSIDLPPGEVVVYQHDDFYTYNSTWVDYCLKPQKLTIHVSGVFWGAMFRSFVWRLSVFVDTPDGDINNDGVVNGVDLGLLINEWGTENSQADLDSNGIVDSVDLHILLANWSNGA